MTTDRHADLLARRAVEEFLDWDPFTEQDPAKIADQVATLPDVLRDALEGYFSTGRLPTYQYHGLSLTDLEEVTGSPIQAVLWMGALFADNEALWPTITLRNDRFLIGEKDAHGAARVHLLVSDYGRRISDSVRDYLLAMGQAATEPAERIISEIEMSLWEAGIASACDADEQAEALATVRRLLVRMRLESPEADEVSLADRVVGAVVGFIETDAAYAREAGWVDEALAGPPRKGPFYDPSDVARLTTALTRKASDEKEITPEVWRLTFRRVQALSPIMRKALAHTLWFGVYPRYEREGVSIANLADRGDELAVLERMDRVVRDPDCAADVLAAAKRARAGPARGAPELSGDAPARSVLAAKLVAATGDFLMLLEEYGEEPVAGLLERLRHLLDRAVVAADGSWPADVAGLRASLTAAVGDGTGTVGRVDLRRLSAGLDLIQTVRTPGP